MNYILKNHQGLDSVERIYSFLMHMEKEIGKDIGKIITEYNTFPCFKKIGNDGMFETLSSIGKVTDTFLSYYDGIEHISRRKLFNPVALKDLLLKRGEDEAFVDKLIAFYIATYVVNNEDAKKEIYFCMYSLNKKLPKGKNLFMAEILEIEKKVMNFVLFKTSEDEDGEKPKANLAGMSLLDSIGKKTITLDIGIQDQLSGIIEDQLNLCDDEDACKAFRDIAMLIGLNVAE